MRIGANPGSPSADSRQFSWSRHGARFSTRSMIVQIASTHGDTPVARVPDQPDAAARSHDAPISAAARSWSNQCHACATSTTSSDAVAERHAPRRSPPSSGTCGQQAAEGRAHPGDRFDREEVGAGLEQQPGELPGSRRELAAHADRGRCRARSTNQSSASRRIRRPRRLVVGRITEPGRRNLVHHCSTLVALGTRPLATTVASYWVPPRIMPAASVSLVASSTRMNEPVARLRRYSSKNSGCVVRSVTRPISLSASDVAVFVAVQRVHVEAVLEVLHQRARPLATCA